MVRTTGLSKAGVEAGVGYLISRDCDSKAVPLQIIEAVKESSIIERLMKGIGGFCKLC